MRFSVPEDCEIPARIERVDGKYKPVWEGRPPEEQIALAQYFLPHRSAKESLVPSRPQVIKWYNPFADQRVFPSGHRYCINVYTGCAHGCVACYVLNYRRELERALAKRGFRKLIDKDMSDLERFDVPPAPVHMSNSTDAFQKHLEVVTRDTLYALEAIALHRRRFTTVTILTKNPLLAAQPVYVDLFKALKTLPPDHPKSSGFAGRPAVTVEVSLAFWRDSARGHYDPCAPSVEERIEGIRALREADIPVVLRIDPLFPPTTPQRTLSEFGSPEAQTPEDLASLVALAKQVGANHVVYSPVKICLPRGGRLSPIMQGVKKAYEALAAPDKLDWHGGSWHLPWAAAKAHIVAPFLDICKGQGVVAKYCKQNLFETP